MPVSRIEWLRRAIVSFVLVVGSGMDPAWAGGTLSLHDVVMAVRAVPALVAEIDGELKASGLAAEDVICSAGRHGNHWKSLAGRRAAPYECKLGKRTLTVEAQQTYYDAKGRSLGDIERADPRRATTFRETAFRWEWAP